MEKELELQHLNDQLAQCSKELDQYKENDPETYKIMGELGLQPIASPDLEFYALTPESQP